MRVLVTGKGGLAGSWRIRGEQIGQAIGAAVRPMATDFSGADLIVLVKRTPPPILRALQRSGKPWVYDIVDGWPQLPGVSWGQERALTWLRAHLKELKPSAVVFGTERMRADSGFRGPSIVVPHHSWAKYLRYDPAIRDDVRTVGYEGVPGYLGRWLPVIERECKARGWDFLINGDMRQADIGIALRDGGGYPAAHWKPGTKLSNLHALGIPALCTVEAGYQSVASGTEFWIEQESDITSAFDVLTERETRRRISECMRKAAIPVQKVASEYLKWLENLI